MVKFRNENILVICSFLMIAVATTRFIEAFRALELSSVRFWTPQLYGVHFTVDVKLLEIY